MIEREIKPLNDFELINKRVLKKNSTDIINIVLTKFDSETLAAKFKDLYDLPVKFFVNCKNSRLSARSKGKNAQLLGDDGNNSNEDDIEDEIANKNEDLITRDEVYFTGRENIEGLACLLNIFVGQMMRTSTNPALLNIDNYDSPKEERIKRGQVFYQASVKF